MLWRLKTQKGASKGLSAPPTVLAPLFSQFCGPGCSRPPAFSRGTARGERRVPMLHGFRDTMRSHKSFWTSSSHARGCGQVCLLGRYLIELQLRTMVSCDLLERACIPISVWCCIREQTWEAWSQCQRDPHQLRHSRLSSWLNSRSHRMEKQKVRGTVTKGTKSQMGRDE